MMIQAATCTGCPAGLVVFKNESQAGSESNCPAAVPPISAKVIKPMVFWASFAPWANPM